MAAGTSAASGDQATHRLAVLGAGVMGVGITTLAVAHGLPVLLIDVDEGKLRQAHVQVSNQLRMAQLMGAVGANTAIGDLVTRPSADRMADVTVVIEAITESVDLKAKALAHVSAATRPGTLLVSNTSAIPIDELAEFTARPVELVGIHFMNPPYLIRMVEVIRGPRTGHATMEGVTSLLRKLDRQPVVVGDAPGFVTSRILHPMINDAVRVVQEGTATVEAVDSLMRGCLGHPTGPLRTADLIGLDNLMDSLWVLHARIGEDRYRPCDLLAQKVRDGKLGRKSGCGFYEYEEALS